MPRLPHTTFWKFDLFPVKTLYTNKKYAKNVIFFEKKLDLLLKFSKPVCDTLLLVIVNEIKHLFCYICEIVGGDRFSAGPPKSVYFLCNSFFSVFQKKYRNKLWMRKHVYYFLVNNKWSFFLSANPLKYLGSQVAADGRCERDVVHRINEWYRAWECWKVPWAIEGWG